MGVALAPTVGAMEALSPLPEATPEDPFVAPLPSGNRATELHGVEVDAQPGRTLVRIKGDGEFAYSGFQLQDPPRLVIDLAGAVKTGSGGALTVSSDIVQRVRMTQYRSQPEPVSRVVFDLAESTTAWVGVADDGLVVRFSDGAGAPEVIADAPEPEIEIEVPRTFQIATVTPDPVVGELAREQAVRPVAAEIPERIEPELQEDLILEVAVLAQTPSPQPAQNPPPNTATPERNFDELFASLEETPEPQSPVQTEVETTVVSAAPVTAPVEALTIAQIAPSAPPVITVAQEPDDSGLAEGITFEGDGGTAPRFGVTNVSGQKQYFGDPISMSLKDAEITEVLRSLARISGLNVVIQPGVSGPLTLELDAVPWDQALEQILKINRLGMELDGNILRIAPVDQLATEAEEQQRLQNAKSLSIPLTTVMRRISYASAGEVATILQSGGRAGGILSQRGSVIVDARTNTLIIQELPAFMDQVIQIIENLDIPEEQVMIEARIVETTKNFSRSLGVEWGYSYAARAETGNTTGLEFPNNGTIDGRTSLLSGGTNGLLGVTMGNVLNTFQLDALLIAAESEGLVNVISAPKIATLNNERASIQSGLQIPVQTVANNTVTVQFVNATLRLDVTPHITAEGTVLLEINIQKREPQLAFAVVGATNAPIATREARTRVLVRDGGTTVIGGIYEVSTSENEDRVPGLANVPILGALFRNKNRNNTNEELLIFITPRIVQL
ncbi:MAG: type IV pilus secretin PilQ [Acidobacteriota bacterium]|nr:type IV pilus secretin PilQ [Acidobacteriota bacterium]